MADYNIEKLRQALSDANFPASKEEILTQLEVERGEEHRWAEDFLATLPDRTYDDPEDIIKEL